MSFPKVNFAAIVLMLVIASQGWSTEVTWSSIKVKKMHCAGCAKKIAARLYTVKGVKEVRVDMKEKTFFVVPSEKTQLSSKAMWEAVEKADDTPIYIKGPSGTITEKPGS